MRVKNWEKFQHYKNRKPPWIRLYRDLLNDPEFVDLPGDAAKHLVMMWLIASEDPDKSGKLPDAKVLAFRLRTTTEAIETSISQLSHWLEHDASTALPECEQDATPDQIRSDQIIPERETPAPVIVDDEYKGNKFHPFMKPETVELQQEILRSFPGAPCDTAYLACCLLRDFPGLDVCSIVKKAGEGWRADNRPHMKSLSSKLRAWCRNVKDDKEKKDKAGASATDKTGRAHVSKSKAKPMQEYENAGLGDKEISKHTDKLPWKNQEQPK